MDRKAVRKRVPVVVVKRQKRQDKTGSHVWVDQDDFSLYTKGGHGWPENLKNIEQNEK